MQQYDKFWTYITLTVLSSNPFRITPTMHNKFSKTENNSVTTTRKKIHSNPISNKSRKSRKMKKNPTYRQFLFIKDDII